MSVKCDTVPWTLPWLTGYNTQWQLDSSGPLSTYTSEALESHSTTGKGAGMLINLPVHIYGHVFKNGWNKCMNCTFQKIIKSKNNFFQKGFNMKHPPSRLTSGRIPCILTDTLRCLNEIKSLRNLNIRFHSSVIKWGPTLKEWKTTYSKLSIQNQKRYSTGLRLKCTPLLHL